MFAYLYFIITQSRIIIIDFMSEAAVQCLDMPGLGPVMR